MRRTLVLVLLAAAAPARADFRPLPPLQAKLVPYASAGVVVPAGEVLVFEGDAEIVSDAGGGDYAISPENLTNIVDRFYLHYPDEFDGLVVFTTFPDVAQDGIAYASCTEGGVSGVAPTPLGGCAGSSRLLSLINMGAVEQYGAFVPGEGMWPDVLAHEFLHSWMVYLHFLDPISGADSSELLGHQEAHWSPAVHAGGSFLYGVNYRDDGGGRFTVIDLERRYTPLDLYAMGVVAPTEVPAFFLIRGAVKEASGEALDPTQPSTFQLSPGDVVTGTRVDLGLADLVAAVGERRPLWDENVEDFHQAVILVTRPGETAAAVGAAATALDAARLDWEDWFIAETVGRAFVCTSVAGGCPRASAKIVAAAIVEAAGADGDGVLEPGEPLALRASLQNNGSVAAAGTFALASESAGVVGRSGALPAIAPLSTIEHDFPFTIESAACGVDIAVSLETTIGTRTWRSAATARPGVLGGEVEPFAGAAGWIVDFDSADTASQGAFAHGVPASTFFAGRTLQPAGGHGGAGDAAWFTDPGASWDSGEVAGGETTLTSAAYDLTGVYRPMLRYWLWYVAVDRTMTTIDPAPDAHLVVAASADGGETWVELEQVSDGGLPASWRQREVELPAAVAASRQARFRFTASDDSTGSTRIVEVGVDDVEIASLSTACRPGDDGCGCRAGGRAPGLGAALLLGLAALLGARRRR